MEDVHSDFILVAMLEIYHFVPSVLLQGVDLMQLPLDKLLYYLAMARTVQDMDSNIHLKALGDAFGE